MNPVELTITIRISQFKKKVCSAFERLSVDLLPRLTLYVELHSPLTCTRHIRSSP
jgi:hypothetical protein